jgi:hypothetical protein
VKDVSPTRYKEIRQRPTFLYEYFMEAGGAQLPIQEFTNLLNVWMQAMGANPQQGHQIIHKYLDDKFAYSK